MYKLKYGDAPCLDSVVIYNEEKEEPVIFEVKKDLEIICDLRHFCKLSDRETQRVVSR